LNRILNSKNENCKIIFSESKFFLDHYVPKNCLNSIFILFPEPWNTNDKKKIIQVEFVNLLEEKLQKDHFLYISTDDERLKNWILKIFESLENWENQFEEGFSFEEPEEVKCQTDRGGFKNALKNFNIFHLKFKKK
jgi:tRNA (guanine-N7-)-methyltransferase